MIQELAIVAGLGLVPTLIGMLLPRKQTIMYGGLVYKIIGTFLAQQGAKITDRTKKVAKAVNSIRTTFVDFAFGIYLASQGLTQAEGEAKILKYLEN